MALDLAKLKNIGVGTDCNVFTYYSSDTVLTMITDGYFDTTTLPMLRVGDVILAASSTTLNGVSTLIVSSAQSHCGCSVAGT
jgi:hypothetical protein